MSKDEQQQEEQEPRILPEWAQKMLKRWTDSAEDADIQEAFDDYENGNL